MRLLQLNTWMFRLKAHVEQIVAIEKPDVICFQEVLEANYENIFLDNLSELDFVEDYPNQFFSPVYTINQMGGQTGFGNAILSKASLENDETVFTNGQFTENFILSGDNYNVRNFQHTEIANEEGQKLHIINHHGYRIAEHKNGNNKTLKACQQIADYASSLKGPIIITGDFNLLPSSDSIKVLNKLFRNLTLEYQLKTTRTNLTFKNEPCDYIFINDHVKLKDFYASNIIASDHQGLVIDFDV